MAEVNSLTNERVDELRGQLWADTERMKCCIPTEKRVRYNGYFNNSGIQNVVSKLEKGNVTLRIGASLDFDIEEIPIGNYMSQDHPLNNILKRFLSDSLISDWDFYQKLRKILRRHELQHSSVHVRYLKEHYRNWIKKNISVNDIKEWIKENQDKKDARYSYILCMNDLNNLESDTPLSSAYLLFKIYSNLIACYEEGDETIKMFKDGLEKQLTVKFYFCFFPWKREFYKKTEKEQRDNYYNKTYTYSNQKMIDIVEKIFPSCSYSDSVLNLSRGFYEDPKEFWNKHLRELKKLEKKGGDEWEKVLKYYGEDLQKEDIELRKIRKKEKHEDLFS